MRFPFPYIELASKMIKVFIKQKNADFNHFDPNLGMFRLLRHCLYIFRFCRVGLSRAKKKESTSQMCTTLVSSLIDHFLF